MGVAWGALAPAGILVAYKFRKLPSSGLWFQIHRAMLVSMRGPCPAVSLPPAEVKWNGAQVAACSFSQKCLHAGTGLHHAADWSCCCVCTHQPVGRFQIPQAVDHTPHQWPGAAMPCIQSGAFLPLSFLQAAHGAKLTLLHAPVFTGVKCRSMA